MIHLNEFAKIDHVNMPGFLTNTISAKLLECEAALTAASWEHTVIIFILKALITYYHLYDRHASNLFIYRCSSSIHLGIHTPQFLFMF